MWQGIDLHFGFGFLRELLRHTAPVPALPFDGRHERPSAGAGVIIGPYASAPKAIPSKNKQKLLFGAEYKHK